MALSRGKKVLLGICISLLVIIIVLPFVLGAFLQGTIASKVKASVKGPVEIGSVKVHLLPPGATINDLVIGVADPAANNQKLLSIGSVYASVPFGVVFGGDLHVTSLGLSDVTANISVNDKGESTLTKFLHDQPPSDRKTALPIDSIQIKNLKVASYVSTRLTNTQKSADAADGRLEVKYLSVQDLVLPAPNSAPPAGNWIKVVLDSMRISGVPAETSAPAAPAVAEGAVIESLTISVALPGSPDKAMEIKNFAIRNPLIGVAVRKEDQTPSLSRAITALQLAVADDKPAANAQPAKVLVQDMLIDNGKFEYRGPDGEGKPAFWRLASIKASGSNIAAGPGVQPAATGGLRISSDSEASTGPGRFSMELVNLTGSYPKSTAQFSFKNEKIAATPFSLQAEQNAKFGIKAGTLTIELNGPITDGALKIDGSVVVSEDLEATGGFRAKVASVARGVPLKTVEVRGTMDKPTINPPPALDVLGAVFAKMVLGGAGDLTKTIDNVVAGAVPEEVGKVMQTATDQVEKIPVIGDKAKKGTDMLKKIPGAGGLFKKKQ